jgi:thiamine-phosphate pyrophosphorylase
VTALPQPPLLLVTDRSQAHGSLDAILDAAFAAGCRWASLRERDLDADAQRALARRLLPIARRHGACLTLHGAAELARTAGLDGVHLSADGDPAAARALLGPAALIGISIHGRGEAAQLDPTVVDYAVAGPMFETASKPGYGPALGEGGIATLVAATAVPVLAIGGIVPATARVPLRAGAAGVAVMGGVMRTAWPGDEVRAFITALQG